MILEARGLVYGRQLIKDSHCLLLLMGAGLFLEGSEAPVVLTFSFKSATPPWLICSTLITQETVEGPRYSQETLDL